jgi:XTP/dITP diphosphohydrolase
LPPRTHTRYAKSARCWTASPWRIVGLDAFPPVAAPDETGTTFAENARLKARYYSAATGMPAIAEDSGLEVDALDGAPGIESARFAAPRRRTRRKFAALYRMLEARGSRESAARFVCALAVASATTSSSRPAAPSKAASRPSLAARIGFGYDPIFFYPPEGRTLGESATT